VRDCGIGEASYADAAENVQIYKVWCEDRGDSLLIEAGAGPLRVCEILVKSAREFVCILFPYYSTILFLAWRFKLLMESCISEYLNHDYFQQREIRKYIISLC
jgi:hypothetical protein